ncbi:MAG: class I SAM-dependent methyltransferase, partial [Candidatus Kryptoniota bacterium]
MRYEPIKDKLGKIVGESAVKRRILYCILGVIFLREWHVKRGLRKIFREKRIESVLDAGSGFGQYSYYIARKKSKIQPAEEAKVCGVDINREEINKCNTFAGRLGLSNLSFGFADLEKLEFNEEFDLVVSVDVMEHIKDDIIVFKNFCKALR